MYKNTQNESYMENESQNEVYIRTWCRCRFCGFMDSFSLASYGSITLCYVN